jgi:hypothetical protein
MPDFDQLARRAGMLDAITASPYDGPDDVAEAMGVRPGLIQRWLAGIDVPSAEESRAFAEATRPARNCAAATGLRPRY